MASYKLGSHPKRICIHIRFESCNYMMKQCGIASYNSHCREWKKYCPKNGFSTGFATQKVHSDDEA